MPFIRHGLFCGLEFEKSKDSPRIHLVKGSKIKVLESTDHRLGALVTYSTNRSRKSFTLPRPVNPSSAAPLAIESFAQDPEHYHKLMDAVEQLSGSQQTQGK